LDDALHYYRRALSSLEVIGGSLWVMGVLHLNCGATYTQLKEMPIAFEQLEKSRELFERAKNRDLLPEMHRRFAEAYLAAGDLGRAREESLASLALAEELAVTNEQGLAWRVIGEVDMAGNDTSSAEASFQKAVELLQSVDDKYGLACAQLSLAEYYDSHEQFELRDNLISECRPVFERLGAAMELERLRPLLAPQLGK
jgi:tetratricopeptide (TPR) repeat protein